ncbi:D-alanyl-D-alanine carboxypeptidase dacA [Candidatus Hamiltonella defensa (Bemisia tabaci)]|nr:D-alanyl-D-alanine carboxypeptidase dacA [Candidatus Hamiltonella defensa (Bemisia tabaci)]
MIIKFAIFFHFIKKIIFRFPLVIMGMHLTTLAYSDSMLLGNLIPVPPEIKAVSYILMDYNSGRILAEKNADERRMPASLTKMMTSYVIGQAIKSEKIGVNDIVTVGKDAVSTGNPEFKGSSLMFLKPGDQVSVAQLTRGITLQSGNDACVAMANYVAGSQDSFVHLMNAYAQEMGLKNTHFKNVHGLDAEGQYTSARDMALMGRALIHDVPDEYAIYKEKEFTFNQIRQLNRNGLLWDKSLNVDGIKTGHTDAAGYNLVASATQGPMRLISVVLGGRTFKERETESKKLLSWGFRFFETVEPLKAGDVFASRPVWFGDVNTAQLGVDKNIYLTLPKDQAKHLKLSFVLNQSELRAPLKKNQIVGSIHFELNGKIIEEPRPLVVLHEVKEGGFFSRMLDYMKLMFHRWFG